MRDIGVCGDSEMCHLVSNVPSQISGGGKGEEEEHFLDLSRFLKS